MFLMTWKVLKLWSWFKQSCIFEYDVGLNAKKITYILWVMFSLISISNILYVILGKDSNLGAHGSFYYELTPITIN
jgi:hypothetical protein